MMPVQIRCILHSVYLAAAIATTSGNEDSSSGCSGDADCKDEVSAAKPKCKTNPS